MSRVIQKTYRLIPSTYTISSANRVTVTDPENMYYNTDHSGSYASIRGRNNTSNTYYAFIHGFNFSDVPSYAVVNSFTVKIKAYRNSYLNTGTTYNLRLASTPSNNSVISNTTLSSALTTGTTGSVYTFPNGSLTWGQIKGYGSNFSIEIPLRSTSNQYPYAYVFGAEIEVVASITEYEISYINASSVANTDPNTTTWVEHNDSLETYIYIDDINDIVFTDNDNVVSQFTPSSQEITTPTIVPAKLDEFVGYNNQISGQTNGCTDANSTTYVNINLRSQSSGAYMIHSFEIPEIPKEATINSVQCQVKASVSNASTSITNKSVQLYANSTPKGTAYTGITTSTTVFSLTTGSNWSPSDFENLKIRVGASYPNTQSYQLRFYGASLTIQYSINGQLYRISNINQDHQLIITGVPLVKESGVFKRYSKIYKKYDGIWRRESYFEDTFTNGTIYVNNS